MKSKTKIMTILTVLVGILTGCSDSFLDRTPEGSYTDANFYASDDAIEAATAPLYNRAWFDYNQRAIVPIGSGRANDMYSPWGNPEFTTFQVTALNELLSSAWKSFYSVITMSNSVIQNIKDKSTGDVSETAKAKGIAEARLMRACAYFYMVRAWGPVILMENNQTIVDNPIQPLNPEEDVFQFIINDLSYAAENLPEKASQPGRATSWAAKGMLAKVYLARAGWKKNGQRDEADLEQAKQLAADVCDNSGLNLLPNYEDLFKYKQNNNEESLLAMQWVPLGEWGVCNTLYADLAFSTEVTGGVNVWSSYAASIDMLQQYELGDTLRRNATFFTQGTYYPYICIADGGYTYTATGSPIKKGVVGGPDDDNDGYVQSMNSPLNTYILRLADVYLTYAEACLGNDQRLTEGPGLEYFNKVRYRAFNGQGDWEKTSITFDDIIKERRIEFCMEYCNWYDMVSWYCWKPDYMLAYFNNQQRGYRAPMIIKDEKGYLHFGNNDASGTFQEGPDYYEEPQIEINISDNDIFFPYPESDVIQNPLLKEEPVPYTFNEETDEL